MASVKMVVREKCIGYTLLEEPIEWTEKDVMLYAVSVGAGFNDPTGSDLAFTYENNENFCILPSFWTTVGDLFKAMGALADCPGLPEFNFMLLLHGETAVEMKN